MSEQKPHRFRMTRQREVILSVLKELYTHPTADEVYQIVRRRLPRISLGTVYRNLDVLYDQGQVLRLELGGGQRRYDGHTHKHHHGRCVHCEHLFDIPEDAVPPIELQLPADFGFEVTNITVEMRGVCRACREAMEGKAGAKTN